MQKNCDEHDTCTLHTFNVAHENRQMKIQHFEKCCVCVALVQDLELLKVEGSSPCGMVKVTLTGQQMPLSCDISDEAMAEGSKAVGEKVRHLDLEPERHVQ